MQFLESPSYMFFRKIIRRLTAAVGYWLKKKYTKYEKKKKQIGAKRNGISQRAF